MLLRTMVAQDFFEALTAEAAENVQEVARLSRAAGSGAAVTAGAGTGLAKVKDRRDARARNLAIVNACCKE